MKYQRIQIVEARKYDGPGRLPVISDALGEQQALPGDWLLGSERGKITVKSAADFDAEGWKLYSETPADDEIAADKQAIAELKAELAKQDVVFQALVAHNSDVEAKYSTASVQLQDQDALKAQVKDLSDKLAAAEAQKAADEAQLAALKATLQQFQDAQAKAEAATEAVNKALNS